MLVSENGARTNDKTCHIWTDAAAQRLPPCSVRVSRCTRTGTIAASTSCYQCHRLLAIAHLDFKQVLRRLFISDGSQERQTAVWLPFSSDFHAATSGGPRNYTYHIRLSFIRHTIPPSPSSSFWETHNMNLQIEDIPRSARKWEVKQAFANVLHHHPDFRPPSGENARLM